MKTDHRAVVVLRSGPWRRNDPSSPQVGGGGGDVVEVAVVAGSRSV
jgi:hypothetical protein